jgi:uncharacterized protein (TIGR04255 family)
MNKRKLRKSPVTYVLAQIKTSSILQLEKYIPELQEAIRPCFPIFHKIDIQTFEIKPNINPNLYSAKQWHFLNKESTTGILLDSDAITIHSTLHNTFEALIENFSDVLNKFNKILNISLCTRIGVRYINVITSNLEKYIKKELLGFHLNNKSNFISNTETIQETQIGLIRIRSAHIGHTNIINHNKNNLIPADLAQTAEYLSFGHHKQPTGSFVILDIDHFAEKQNDFDTKKIIHELSQLHEDIYNAFHSAVTNTAIQDWG